MSTQTGIRPDAQLSAFFARCRGDGGGRTRLIQVKIRDEAMVLERAVEADASWQRDWDRAVLPLLRPAEPCYLLLRLDERDPAGNFLWILISWSPDESKVRQKMLYASSKATLKMEFGGGQIRDDLYGNVKDDVSLEGYRRHLKSLAAPGPLSREEMEREEVRKAEVNTAVSVDTKHQTMSGLLFPMTRDAARAVSELQVGRLDYVQLSINVSAETIELEAQESGERAGGGRLTALDVVERTPADKPRYHILVYRYTHEGDAKVSTVFIYTMPGYSCSIKERMLYSSCKNGLVESLQHKGITVDKRIEVDSAKEITDEFLVSELHPLKNLHRPKFAKPAPPSRAGNRRITKPPTS